MSNRSKNHHFVPKVLQKQFVAEKESIWHSARGKNGHFAEPTLKKIEKAFRRRNLYTVVENGVMSDIVEREFYGAVDNYLGTILPKIRDAFNRARTPVFEGTELDSLRRAVVEMAKRTPEFTANYDIYSIGEEILRSTRAALLETNDQVEVIGLSDKLVSGGEAMKYGRTALVLAAISQSEVIEAELSNFSARWVVSETHHSFILSSLMVYRIGNGGPNAMINPKMEFWMPVSPKECLVLLRDPDGKVPLKITETRDHIRQVNVFAARNSQEIASCSRKLLESIIRELNRSSPHLHPKQSPE